MIILHLGFFVGNCYLWGETPAEHFPKRRGRPPKKPKLLPSPFDVSGAKLKLALAAGGIEIEDKAETAMTAWLPSVADRPVGSSLLVAPPPSADQELTIRPWKVTALCLLPDDAISFLTACAGRRNLAPSVVIGADIAFWVQALRFVGSLAARGRFLPGVKQEKKGYVAVWEPVLSGNDMESLVALARSMPASCYCLTADNMSPDIHAPSVVFGFSALIIDTLARQEAGLLQGKGRARAAGQTSMHQRWLAALKTPSGFLLGDPAELVKLTYQIKEWRRRVYTLSAAPYRFCFRLEEPDPVGSGSEDETWVVRYLLQAKDDPSLLIPVLDAWKGGVKLKITGENLAVRREFILTALGQAACFSPQIEDSVRSGIPAGITLNSSGAFDFLRNQAPLLKQAGFAVMLPAWWTSQGSRARLTITGRAVSSPFLSPGSIGLDDVVSFDWQVALGDEVLTAEELAALARLKSPLVKLRGQWVEGDAGEIKEALNFWRKKASHQLTARDVVKLSLGVVKQPDNLPLRSLSASGWLGDLLQRLQGDKPCPDLPSPLGLNGQLRPYQLRGYAWLNFLSQIGFGACLADDMGLGKTIQCLAVLQHRYEQGLRGPALLICPTSVIANWEKEAARFTPELPLLVHHGPARKKGNAFKKAAEKQALVISSYALLGREGDLFQKVQWDGVILDEAQNIKNPLTQQAQAARSLKANYRIALTGTPVENNVGDLWSVMEFLNPGLLGNQAEFKRSFLVPIQIQHNQKVARTLKRLTGPFILRRLKTDRSIIQDLPDKIESKVFCSLTQEQASLYAAVIEEIEAALDISDGIQRQGLILAALSKFKQVCNHPAQFLKDNSELAGRSGKLIRLTEILEEILAAGERALIFTQFADMGRLLHRYLMETFGYPALFLHGGVPKKERDQMIDLFQGEDGPPFFILTIKAGGTGLNLTQANHVFHFDRWWNPAVENQATDRVYRIGQQKNVQVYKFVCKGTIEERIDEIIERKLELAENIVGSGESWLTKLTTAEFKQLMALREEAVGDW
ncbi:MAG: DEAD/DEAH box helicase [Firmicutes bacterium]|nr:DEAD/DEAH box helicase [Bacillota bacterium]